MITVGSMYSGYGGLELAIAAASALPARTLWHVECDPDARTVLAVHHPGVPCRHSDRLVRWCRVERPEILAMGPPCQPTSAAGRGLGTLDPRWRWPYALAALVGLRPAALVFENVAGLTSHDGGRTWAGILADMRAAGYAVAWGIYGACVVGAPHHRHRVFAVGRLRPCAGAPVRVGTQAFCGLRTAALPSPMARDGDGRGEGSAEYWDARRARRERQGLPLGATVRLLPTGIGQISWGEFAPAVERWSALTRPAPTPVEPTARGGGLRLAPELPEWMQGLPAGYLTDHVDRNAALRLAGNGVCPQQGAYAIRHLWPHA